MGLARDKPHFLSNSEESIRGPSYLHALAASGLINEATFSISISSNDDSAIDFGAHDTSRVKAGSELQWIDVIEDFFWSQKCAAFAIGDTENSW